MAAAAPGFARRQWDALLRAAERRLPALTRHRVPEPLPIALHARRIYILPTGFGVFFGVTLAAMLLGGLNYDNNPALLLTFALAGAAVLAMHRTVDTLRGLRLLSIQGARGFAGDPLVVHLHVEAPGPRRSLELRREGGEPLVVDLGAGETTVAMAIPTARRGWLPAGRWIVASEYPLGLFRAWSVLHPQHQLLVYPRPETNAPPLPRSAAGGRGEERRGSGEDWFGLRDFRAGDAPRRIAWKPSARQDRLLVREFAEPRSEDLVLDWFALEALTPDARIARLTRWVLEAGARDVSFRLRLPGLELGPGRGAAHGERCLRELALLP